MLRRLVLVLLAVFLLVPACFPRSTAAELNESEAIYFGKATTMLGVAIEGVSDLLELFDHARISDDKWWVDVGSAFGVYSYLSSQADDADPPASMFMAHQLLSTKLSLMEGYAESGLLAVGNRDVDGLEVAAQPLLEQAQSLDEVTAELKRVIDGESSTFSDDTSSSTSNADSVDPDSSSSPGTITLSGVGSMVTEPINLESGTYVVEATVTTSGIDGFAVTVYGGDVPDLLFNEVLDPGVVWTSSQVFQAEEAGQFYVETSNTESPWSLSFTKLG